MVGYDSTVCMYYMMIIAELLIDITLFSFFQTFLAFPCVSPAMPNPQLVNITKIQSPLLIIIIVISSFSQGETYVMYGDECGNISILVFHNPDESLFVTESKDIVSALEDIQMVLYSVRSFCQLHTHTH